MIKKEYSAAAVKFSFWFAEFRKVISLIQSGKSIEDIKSLAENENIFSASTPMRSRQIFNTVSARVSSLSDSFYEIFGKCTLESQRQIALIAIMNTDSLFFDFMNEVFREKLIIGDTKLTDADIRVFFLNKQRESEKVSGWTDETLTRLHRCYKTYLAEAGLVDRGVGDRNIIRPLMDDELRRIMSSGSTNQHLIILSGTR